MIPKFAIHKTTTGNKVVKYIPKRNRSEQPKEEPITIQSHTDHYKDHYISHPIPKFTSNEIISTCLYEYNDHTNQVNHIRWNPQYNSLFCSCSNDHFCYIYSIESNQGKIQSIQHSQAVSDIRWSHDGNKLFTSCLDCKVQYIDILEGKPIHTFSHKDWITSLCVHPTDPCLFLCGSSRNGIVEWDTRINKVIHIYKEMFGQVEDLMFLDDESFVSASDVIRRNSVDKGLMVWNLNTGCPLSNQIYMEGYNLTSLSKHPSRNVFVCQTTGSYMIECDSKKPYHMNKRKRFEGHDTTATKINCCYSPSGSLIATGSTNGSLFFYNSSSTSIVHSRRLFNRPLLDVSYHPTRTDLLACCDSTGRIKILTSS